MALSSDHCAAQQPEQAVFAEPVRIMAGDEFAGEGRYYPSPVLQDVDGDGRAHLVIGDLIGRVTYASRTSDTSKVVFDTEKPLKDRRGEQIRFHNW